jgi:hypothetical protein
VEAHRTDYGHICKAVGSAAILERYALKGTALGVDSIKKEWVAIDLTSGDDKTRQSRDHWDRQGRFELGKGARLQNGRGLVSERQ